MLENRVKPNVTIFDVSMIYHTGDLIRNGLLELPLHVMFVMGGHMGLEARQPLLDFLISESDEVFGKDNYNWSVVGVGWNHITTQQWGLDRGGNVRTGFEDSLMISRGKFARSNKELVENVVRMSQEVGRPIATHKQARQIIGLKH